MKQFILSEFVPILKGKKKIMDSLPKYMAVIQPLVQIIAFLYYLEKDRHVHMIHKIHALFCEKVKDDNFQEGIHKLVISVIAALMTQSDQAIRMYPVLTGLGKLKVENFHQNKFNS